MIIREAVEEDRPFVVDLMVKSLEPYYGGDHEAHARRIFDAHIGGGQDRIGHFSFEQRMFIAVEEEERLGMVHLVGKRQNTYKISPIIVTEAARGKSVGQALVEFAENYAAKAAARQIYCTVAQQNRPALQLFNRNGYVTAGESASHYKIGITELMLYKQLQVKNDIDIADKYSISVTSVQPEHEFEIRNLLLEKLQGQFKGVDDTWIDSLMNGYRRRESKDINLKYKLLFVATDTNGRVLGVAGATPKKGEPIKLMPFIASDIHAFKALLADLPFQLKEYGHKLYMHICPTVAETRAIQQHGWKLDAALPSAYHPEVVTQQWSLDLSQGGVMRMMRVKEYYLKLILSGAKTLEVRVAYDSIKTIRPGERIQLASSTRSAKIQVSDVHNYSSFLDMLEHEDPDKISPGMTREAVLKLLRDFYPPNKENLGVVVLVIKLLPGSEGKAYG